MALDSDERRPHPPGLSTLFLTEMWERFSYYGMRGLLILFLVAAVENGGLGLSEKVAGAIYGLYAAGVYLAALPGGWVGDRLLGAQRTVLLGGIVIALGQFALTVPLAQSFYLGLVLLIVGTGLLKPNVSTIVGQLYPEGGARRDAGFTIFYMGINLGATIGPFVCSWLGERWDWHLGFFAAGTGMLFGLAQYSLTRRRLGEAGLRPSSPPQRHHWLIFAGGLAAVGVVTALALTGVLPFDPLWLARWAARGILLLAAVYFTCVMLFFRLTKEEKKRLGVILVLFLSSAVFWAGSEQAGSSLNLFAKDYTERHLGWGEQPIPAGWFQMLNAAFVVILAPGVAALWVVLARRKLNPSLPAKFGYGLLFLGAGFLVIAMAAMLVARGGWAEPVAGAPPEVRHKVWPTWLVVTYLLHTLGELCVSPVGLSSVTKLAPPKLVGQMMGLWFLATSLGNLMAGLLAGELRGESLDQIPALFWQVCAVAGGTGLLLIAFSRPIKRLMAGVE